MKILLDTQIFLWYISDDKRLSRKHYRLISDNSNVIYLSTASIWECCIKQQIGKLKLPSNPAEYLSEKRSLHSCISLPIDESSLKHLFTLPLLHKDPFDRILICQSIEYLLKFLTEDEKIHQYQHPHLNFG
ncbi:MAG: type II toxin-antitoxin system VapC family toxin [Bacteroidetes bacterium]|nr:type II toxin-antitoxin system VapC family toxin [Bacteroidota bacterium]